MTRTSKADAPLSLSISKALGLLLLLFAALAGGSPWLSAQVTTAEVVGTVTDGNGAILPGATVVIKSLDTDIAQTTSTNSAGDYAFNLLPIGRYTLTVSAPNFKTFKIDMVALAAADRSRLDAKMAVGALTETVEVTSVNASVQTDSSTVGSLIDTKAVQDLPLNGRNYVNLVSLTPGVTTGTAPGGNQSLSSGTRPDDRRQSSAYSANGQDPSANNNMIDGVDNNDRLIGTIGVRPSIDAIAEVRVQTISTPRRSAAPRAAWSTSSRSPAPTASTARSSSSSATIASTPVRSTTS